MNLHLITKCSKSREVETFCIQANLENPYVVKVHNLVSAQLSHPKYQEAIENDKLSFYLNAFDYARKNIPEGAVVCVCEPDVFLSHTDYWPEVAKALQNRKTMIRLTPYIFDGTGSAQEDTSSLADRACGAFLFQNPPDVNNASYVVDDFASINMSSRFKAFRYASHDDSPLKRIETLALGNPFPDFDLVRLQNIDLNTLPAFEKYNIVSASHQLTLDSQLDNNIEKYIIISYCSAKYPENFGGVPRFDHHLSLVFPNRVWFGPHQKREMLIFLQTMYNNRLPVLVITDNQYACDIPNEIPIVLVHHGVAAVNAERNPDWDPEVKKICLDGQNQMLQHRKPENTLILSISHYCTDHFTRLYGDQYTAFGKREMLWHTSELNPYTFRTSLSTPTQRERPIVLGNWGSPTKGARVISALQQFLPQFEFRQLKTTPTQNIEEHNREKAEIYRNADIFLQLSNAEGYGYATLDAFNQNLLVCGTNVGLLYDIQMNHQMHGDQKVAAIFDWEKRDDIVFVAQQIKDLWDRRDEYFGNSRKWFLKNANLDDWKIKFKKIVAAFLNTV
jgi:hypothetical protein